MDKDVEGSYGLVATISDDKTGLNGSLTHLRIDSGSDGSNLADSFFFQIKDKILESIHLNAWTRTDDIFVNKELQANSKEDWSLEE